ncbi:MAG TPA: hypothetical protein VHE99_01670 [Gammaproteobacteria bacterium]|nr:hypothetical protein [Gammaproteobacteria bacterium]
MGGFHAEIQKRFNYLLNILHGEFQLLEQWLCQVLNQLNWIKEGS